MDVAALHKGLPDLLDRQDNPEEMASLEDLEVLDNQVPHHHAAMLARLLVHHPAVLANPDSQAHQDRLDPTENLDDLEDPLPREARDLLDHLDHPARTVSLDTLESQEALEHLEKLPEALLLWDRLAHLDLTDSQEDQANLDSLEVQAILEVKDHQETTARQALPVIQEKLVSQATLEDPVAKELATTVLLLALRPVIKEWIQSPDEEV